jgi:hypothetical protein
MKNIEKLKQLKPEMDTLFGSKTTNNTRRPYFDIGEFLPALLDDEIEFARINLKSSTGDVISLRLNIQNNEYTVNVVDEYQTAYVDFIDTYSDIPTQGEVLNIITSISNEDDNEPLLIGMIHEHGYESIQDITDFIHIDSNVYPYLNELLIHYLIEKGFNSEEGSDDIREMKEDDFFPDSIKKRNNRSDWDSIMGTLCFNIWNRTNQWFTKTNDIRYIDISFICGLNVFQKWEQIYLSRKYKLNVIGNDASDDIKFEAKDLINNLTEIKEFIAKAKESNFGQSQSSKHFISLFGAALMRTRDIPEKDNPLAYFQTGIEILCLFIDELKSEDDAFYNELLDIGDMEKLVTEIIAEINGLEEFEK